MRFNIATGYDTPVLLPPENSQTFSHAFQQKRRPIKLFIGPPARIRTWIAGLEDRCIHPLYDGQDVLGRTFGIRTRD